MSRFTQSLTAIRHLHGNVYGGAPSEEFVRDATAIAAMAIGLDAKEGILDGETMPYDIDAIRSSHGEGCEPFAYRLIDDALVAIGEMTGRTDVAERFRSLAIDEFWGQVGMIAASRNQQSAPSFAP